MLARGNPKRHCVLTHRCTQLLRFDAVERQFCAFREYYRQSVSNRGSKAAQTASNPRCFAVLQNITLPRRTIETVNPCPTSSMSGAAQTTRFSGRINHKPFHSNDFRAIVVADSRPRVSFRLFRNLPGFAFIRFPYFLRLNTVSFLTIEGEIYQLLSSVSI